MGQLPELPLRPQDKYEENGGSISLENKRVGWLWVMPISTVVLKPAPGTAVSASPENSLGMQVPRPHSRLIESEALAWGKPSR